MASCDESFDLYSCQVCLENMLDRDPRLLSCLHSFCKECLEKLQKFDLISCPICRETTKIPNYDINKLKVNFMLKKFKDHLDKLQSNKSVFCQMCLSHSATVKCQDCMQFLCGDCKIQHNKIESFYNHTVYNLCQKHIEGATTHACVKCMQPACPKCIMKEHSDCKSDVKIYEVGMKEISMKVMEGVDELHEQLDSVDAFMDEHKSKLEKINTGIVKVRNVKRFYKDKVTEAESTLETLVGIKEKGERIKDTYREKDQEWRSQIHMIQKRRDEIERGVYDNLWDVKAKLDNMSIELNDDVNYSLPDIQILDPVTRKILYLTHEIKRDVYLKKAVLVKDITSPEEDQWQRPLKIAVVDDEYILVCDWDKDYLTMVSLHDNSSVKIASKFGKVRDAIVRHDYLYTAYETCLSRRSFDNRVAGNEMILRPPLREVSSMVLNDWYVYLLSRKEQTIIEFNINNNATKIISCNLQDPVNIDLVQNEGRVMYCVSSYGTHSVSVYDDRWRLMFRLGEKGSGSGQFRYPFGVTYTTEGILVADQENQRVSEFSFEGRFIRHVLDSKDCLGGPFGIVFANSYLWLSQGSPYSIKCFKICE